MRILLPYIPPHPQKVCSKYNFIILPYKFNDGEYVYGEKIKLPSVLVEGKSNILETEWWED